jgi:hypothetical protein
MRPRHTSKRTICSLQEVLELREALEVTAGRSKKEVRSLNSEKERIAFEMM